MTKASSHPAPRQVGRWRLADAKSRLSELVRSARTHGPQTITVHGREEVVVISADEFHRLCGERTGLALVELCQASPHRDIDLIPSEGVRSPSRDIDLS